MALDVFKSCEFGQIEEENVHVFSQENEARLGEGVLESVQNLVLKQQDVGGAREYHSQGGHNDDLLRFCVVSDLVENERS